MRSRGRVIALATGVLLLIGCTAAVAVAPTTNVACTITSNTLSCPLPAPVTSTVTKTSTVSKTATVTKTVTATPSTSASPTGSTPATSTPVTTTPAAGLNCAPNPSSCGYPDATNTGARGALAKVPSAVTSGTGWAWSNGSGCVEVRTDGATLANVEVTGCVEVYANNVTISNVRVLSDALDWWGIGIRGASGTTIQDTTVTSPAGKQRLSVAIKDVTGGSSGTTVRRVDVSRVSTGIQTHEGLIEDSYIHDLEAIGGDHVNGICSNGSTTAFTIRHNTVLNPLDQADAIALFQDFGVEANRTVDNNLMAGGSYTLYAGGGSKGTSSNIKITNNRFSKIYLPNGGAFGPVTAFQANGAGNVFTGNVWDGDNSPVSAN